MSERRYQISDGAMVGPAAYAKYLRECARRWRFAPAFTEKARVENEEQAQRVEAKAERIERGEE